MGAMKGDEGTFLTPIMLRGTSCWSRAMTACTTMWEKKSFSPETSLEPRVVPAHLSRSLLFLSMASFSDSPTSPLAFSEMSTATCLTLSTAWGGRKGGELGGDRGRGGRSDVRGSGKRGKWRLGKYKVCSDSEALNDELGMYSVLNEWLCLLQKLSCKYNHSCCTVSHLPTLEN